MDRLFEWVFLAGYAFYMLVLIIPSEMQSRRTTVREKRDNSGGKVLSVLAALGLYIIPIIDVLNPEARIVDMEVPPAAWLVSGIAGTLIFGFALWLLWHAYHVLGRGWSGSLYVREKHALVTGGVYRLVRHPIYLGLWLWTLAQLLLLQNWITGLSGLICFLPLYLYRVPREEQMMIDTFGEEYLDYMSKTPRLLPRIWPQSWREKSG
jgi:protein-S-isoprenylcysteine O-methyltransferase Ste14